MIIRNNKPVGHWLFYKIGGAVGKVWIHGYGEADVPITSVDQIILNAHDQALRNHETKFGIQESNTWGFPTDPDFPTITVSAATVGWGTISPSGSVSVKYGENQKFTMLSSGVTITLSSDTLTIGGSISGDSSVASRYPLTALTLDAASVFGDITGDATATLYYTMLDVMAPKTLVATFGVTPNAQTSKFTIVAGSGLTILVSGATGGVVTGGTFVGFPTVTGGTASTVTNYYLTGLTDNSSDVLSQVSGNVSGTSTYEATGITSARTILAGFDVIPTTYDFNISAFTGNYLTAATFNAVDVLSDVIGNLSGSCRYTATGLTDSSGVFIASWGVY